MPRVEIAYFDISVTAESTFWSHGVGRKQVEAMLDHPWIVIANREDRAAPLLLLGRDDQGRCLAVPILPTDDRLVWRPVTAWYCKRAEAAMLRQLRI